MKTNRILGMLMLLVLMIVTGLPGAAPPVAAQQDWPDYTRHVWPAQGAGNPWDTPVGQGCFERWIGEAMSRLNSYNGDKNFNDNKPYSINKYGLLEGRYFRSASAPDNFDDYNYNKYWYMWDLYPHETEWSDANWRGAKVPLLRDYVRRCVAEVGGATGGAGQPGGTGAGGASGQPGGGGAGGAGGQPGGGGGQPGTGGQPGGGSAGLCTVNTGSGIVINAVDNDGENKLNECETLRVPFGDSTQDARRCFTFRYTVPPGGITSAALHVVLIPGWSLQDTDSLALAIGQANPDCDWAKGKMSGCVTLHGGFRGDEKCMNLDLLNAGCDPSVKIPPEVQQAVTAQLNTGVLHFMLQDDTGIEGAQLVLNGGPTTFPCGTSAQPVGTGGAGGAGGTGGTGGTGGAGGATNTTLPTPPYGQSEPNTNVPGMTLQAGQRKVIAGEVALVPVWLIKAQNVANLNFDVQYDAKVARPAGAIQRGSLMDNTMLSTNPNELGVVRVGFARTSGLSGTGSVVYIPFRAEGQPGDRTALTLAVTTINDPSGGAPAIDRINGEILIVGPDGLVSGDCDGDGWLTESDALCALEISVKLRPVLTALDLDRSGDVTSRDATLILLRALGRR